jgi:recombination protein RecA
MRDKIVLILDKVKERKIPVSRIEKELGFANGLLGKVRDDETRNLSQENFDLLVGYAEKNELLSIVEEKNIESATRPISITPSGSLRLAPSAEKLKAGQDAINKINKDFGEGSIFRLGDKPKTDISVIPTGILLLDEALGVGGFPCGRMVEIYGPEGSGKTTIALSVIAQTQKAGGKCVLIDAEHSLNEQYAKLLGVNLDELYISQPDHGEQALEETDQLVLTGSYSVIVIDSIAALTPKAELEGAMGDSKLGLQARLMSQACRKLVASISKTNTLVVFINQLREKIGVMYGPTEVTTGGNALKFYASARIDVRKTGVIKDGDTIVGSKHRARVVKNKVAPPYKQAEFDIIFGEGIDIVGGIIDIATEKNIIQKSGSWYSYGENKLGQGRDAVKQLLKDNPDLLAEINSKLTTI